MNETAIVEIGIFVIGGIFSVVWFLLRQKDRQQETQIAELLKKHEGDVQELNDHRIHLADSYYKKSEVDKSLADHVQHYHHRQNDQP